MNSSKFKKLNKEIFQNILKIIDDENLPVEKRLIDAVNEVLPHTFDFADCLLDSETFTDELFQTLGPFTAAAFEIDLTKSLNSDGDTQRRIPHKNDLLHFDDKQWVLSKIKAIRKNALDALEILKD